MKNSRSVSYKSAQSLILNQAGLVGTEPVSLVDSYGRISFQSLEAILPEPGYDQSLRDGFALGKGGNPVADGVIVYQLSGEIPAGSPADFVLNEGWACRIMTGALLPKGCTAIVQQEECSIEHENLVVPSGAMNIGEGYIQKQGSNIGAGTIIVPPGERLTSNDIALLAATGVVEVEVYRRPKVAFFCSGSELVAIDKCCSPGQKVSSNRYLLNCLLEAYGAEIEDLAIVEDDGNRLETTFSKIAESDNDIIISTGGLGPGKYDLLEAAFKKAGGRLIYRRLDVRPGKTTLFGLLGEKLYFGLPGPPTAVSVLFHEFIGPALRKMQGLAAYANVDLRAALSHDVTLYSSDVLCLRKGVLSVSENGRTVRFAQPLESADCHILLPGGISSYQQGDVVTIHMTTGITLS